MWRDHDKILGQKISAEHSAFFEYETFESTHEIHDVLFKY